MGLVAAPPASPVVREAGTKQGRAALANTDAFNERKRMVHRSFSRPLDRVRNARPVRLHESVAASGHPPLGVQPIRQDAGMVVARRLSVAAVLLVEPSPDTLKRQHEPSPPAPLCEEALDRMLLFLHQLHQVTELCWATQGEAAWRVCACTAHEHMYLHSASWGPCCGH